MRCTALFWIEPNSRKHYLGRLLQILFAVLSELYIASAVFCWKVIYFTCSNTCLHPFSIHSLLMHSSLNNLYIISTVSELLFPKLKQNLMQIRGRFFHQEQKRYCNQTHAVHELTGPVGNYAHQRVCKDLRVTPMPHRCHWKLLTRRYEGKLYTFGTNLVCSVHRNIGDKASGFQWTVFMN